MGSSTGLHTRHHSPEPENRQSQGRIPICPKVAILLAITLGLSGGYLDLVMMIFRKLYWSELRYFGSGRDFVWSVPLVHVVLLLIPGVLLAAISVIRTRLVSLAVGWWYSRRWRFGPPCSEHPCTAPRPFFWRRGLHGS
jgi:hypothetical protein